MNGGYSQQDVQELARILTGWTVSGLRNPGPIRMARPGARRGQTPTVRESEGPLGFAYQDLLHEHGARTVLGVRYGDQGVAQGEQAIRNLCRHPSTAQFVATKLVTHFVADDPPPGAVEKIAAAFRESRGDLRAVSRAVVGLPEAWSAETQKFRTPQEWLVAVMRTFRITEVGDPVLGALRRLRHPLWSPPSPKGFSDTAQDWADPDSLLNRAELARTMARRLGGGIDAGVLLDVVDVAADDPLRALLSDRSIPASDRIALGIAGPAFQWR